MSEQETVPRRRVRQRLVVGALVVLVLGLALRFGWSGPVADLSGGVLYAVLVHLLLCWAVPAARPALVAAAAAGWCGAVELFQLSGWPAAWAAEFPPSALVLGTGFAAWDLVSAAVGVGAAWIVDAAGGWSRWTGRPEGSSAST